MIKCEIYVQLFTGPQCIWYLSSFFHHKQTTNKYSDLHTFKIWYIHFGFIGSFLTEMTKDLCSKFATAFTFSASSEAQFKFAHRWQNT